MSIFFESYFFVHWIFIIGTDAVFIYFTVSTYYVIDYKSFDIDYNKTNDD